MFAYFDNSATTKPLKEVGESINFSLENNWGNPSSIHGFGLKAELVLEEARDVVGRSLGVSKNDIYFSSSGSLANNVAIFGAVSTLKRRGNHIITTSVEHASVSSPFKELEKQGYDVTYIKPDFLKDNLKDDILKHLKEDTILVSLMMVNNEIGQIFDVFEIAREIKRKNKLTLFHTDAVQAYMKIQINLKNSDIDLLTFSGHKFHAPKGVGCLYIKKGVRITPSFFGGNQESGFFPGTQNVLLIDALSVAIKNIESNIDANFNKVLKLKEYTKDEFKKIDDSFFNIPKHSIPYILSAGIKGIKSEVLLHYLSDKNIYISSGSACSKGEKSRILTAYSIDDSLVDSTIRISFSPFSTIEEVDYLLKHLRQATKDIRKM